MIDYEEAFKLDGEVVFTSAFRKATIVKLEKSSYQLHINYAGSTIIYSYKAFYEAYNEYKRLRNKDENCITK